MLFLLRFLVSLTIISIVISYHQPGPHQLWNHKWKGEGKIWKGRPLQAEPRQNPWLDQYPKAVKYRIDSNITKVYPAIERNNEVDDMYKEREMPDFENLQPNDPFFLDMGWPSARSPAASAFARHLQWKRQLTDGERKIN